VLKQLVINHLLLIKYEITILRISVYFEWRPA